jgi:hypothetical protein
VNRHGRACPKAAAPGLLFRVAVAVNALACATPALVAQDRWSLEVGHAYSSVRAIRQPATFSLTKGQGRPWLSQVDAALLATGPFFPSFLHEADIGLRASGGSLRRRGQRVYSAMIRGFRASEPLRSVVALSGEYETDGALAVSKGVIGLELTPYGVGAIALGRWSGGNPDAGLLWRPWLGLGYGTVFATDQAAATVEPDGFWRAHFRVEGAWRSPSLRLDAEATTWLLDWKARGTNFARFAVSVPVGGGFSLTGAAERGRRPPRFVLTEQITVGLGFRAERRSP